MEQNQEKFKNFISSQNLKAFLIGILILFLLIPGEMIKQIIQERKLLNTETENEIQKTWGKNQVVGGPILILPYTRLVTAEGKVSRVKSNLTILPESLNISGQVTPEFRYRGIYKVVVYHSNLELSGQFPDLKNILPQVSPEDICWNEMRLEMGISDLRGIQSNIQLRWDQNIYATAPGTTGKVPFTNGISAPIKYNEKDLGIPHNFSIKLNLSGSKELTFLPVGKITRVSLASTWKTPKFTGAFLPKHRQISKNGFKAEWQVLHFNRNYPQEWLNRKYELSSSAFGVNFLVPVDRYQKSMRSVKYAILFFTLTFTMFFFVEILSQKKLAIIQYFMVGLSLLVFYILLLSLSEHIGFLGAYLIASAAIVLQITLFVNLVFHTTKTTLLTASILATLYGMLFILLQLQDYALLIGSIGLFIILGVIMFLSRNLKL